MKTIQDISAHRQNGWQGQYNRMIRWREKFEKINNTEYHSEMKTHDYFDTMYACFQNIFFIKDWLSHDTSLKKEDLNVFINENTAIGICRDICNGTKHYNITHASVDSEFGIIQEMNQFHEQRNLPKIEIKILAGGKKYKPLELISECIGLWDNFITENLNLTKSKKE